MAFRKVNFEKQLALVMLGMLIALGLVLLHLVIAVRQAPHPQTHIWEEDNEWLIKVHIMS